MIRLSPDFLEFRLGDRRAHVSGLLTPSVVDQVSSRLTADKVLAYKILSDAGVPLPEYLAINARDLTAARAFYERIPGPLVVKPSQGKGGAGVVGNIVTFAQLKKALTSTGRYVPDVILEQQITGASYRVLFLDGELIDVVRRELPSLEGDGTSTIGQLMLREYERRLEAGGDLAGYKPFDVDVDCLFTLTLAGVTLDTVLPHGRSIVVRTATNYSGPDKSETAGGELCDAIVAAARRAAYVTGPRLAGVDLITRDPTRALEETGGVVLEVNVPGLHHHYNVLDRSNASKVAIPILAAMLKERSPGNEGASAQ
jgi:D-alanine-D-alanine ligase-like ATP-grasp enzyme